MLRIFWLIAFLLFSLASFTQDKPAYVIYNAKGKKVSYADMIEELKQKEIILFGEIHNNPISHWLQLKVTKDLNQVKKLILGAEMIETDNQEALDHYLSGTIDQSQLDSLARLWTNYKTDYAPLVDFAKSNNIPFIGTNVPRKYANMVYKNGFDILDTLPEIEKNWIAPLPIAFDSELKTYKNILNMMGDHGSPLLVMAQATKDATMAHFILKNYQSTHTFLHFNGSYHSDDYEGILWYLKSTNSRLRYATITTVSQSDLTKLEKEYKNKADYIICVDADMTTTY
jgi:uncharacterized iron-regulated protein